MRDGALRGAGMQVMAQAAASPAMQHAHVVEHPCLLRGDELALTEAEAASYAQGCWVSAPLQQDACHVPNPVPLPPLAFSPHPHSRRLLSVAAGSCSMPAASCCGAAALAHLELAAGCARSRDSERQRPSRRLPQHDAQAVHRLPAPPGPPHPFLSLPRVLAAKSVEWPLAIKGLLRRAAHCCLLASLAHGRSLSAPAPASSTHASGQTLAKVLGVSSTSMSRRRIARPWPPSRSQTFLVPLLLLPIPFMPLNALLPRPPPTTSFHAGLHLFDGPRAPAGKYLAFSYFYDVLPEFLSLPPDVADEPTVAEIRSATNKVPTADGPP